MELPTYQSRQPGPASSGLRPAEPAITGGGAIQQGLHNMASGLLVMANYEQQQQQAEQVALAGRTIEAVSTALLRKEQELRERQAADPNAINPRDLNRDYQDFADKLTQDTLGEPTIAQHPYLQKYLDTHLPTVVGSYKQNFQNKANIAWEGWNQHQGLQAIDGLTGKAAQAETPEQQAVLESLIDKQIAGMVVTHSMTGEQGNAARINARNEIATRRAQHVIGMKPEAYLEAVKRGTVDVFLMEHRIPVEATASLRKEFLSMATAQATLNQNEQNRQLADTARLRVETHRQTSRALMDKFLRHMDDPASPALTFGDIQDAVYLDQMDGEEARAMQSMLATHASGPAVKSDQGTLRSLFTRMTLPYDNPQRLTTTGPIYDAAGKGKLSIEDARALVNDFEKARSVDGENLLATRRIFLDSKKSAITRSNPLMGEIDREGDDLYGKFEMMVRREEDKAIRDHRNPLHLYDDSKPDYLGQQVPQFQKRMLESVEATKSLSDTSRGEKVPLPSEKNLLRKPGETIDEYLKRRGKK